MFSNKKRLIERTGYNKTGRYDYLKLLATEFKVSKSRDAKLQVLANLANFAYDPINYEYIRQLQIIDIFLHALSESDECLVTYAVGGLCNLCLDPINREFILRNQGAQLISALLTSTNEDCVLSAITTLMFLITESSKSTILTPETTNKLTCLSNSTNNRIKNLAVIFLTDHCDTEIVARIQQSSESVPDAGTSIKLTNT